MAWAIDATSFKNREDSPTSAEVIAHTCTGSDLILFVSLMYYAASPAGTAVVSVTYNGTAMTKLSTQTSAGGGSVELWYLKNPSTGSNNISVSWTGTNSQLSAANASFTGIEQTPTITDSDVQAFSVRTSSQISLTGMNVGDLIVGVTGGGSSTYNVNTGTTLATRPSSNPQVALGYLSAAASSDTIDFTNGSDWTTAIAMAVAEASSNTTVNVNTQVATFTVPQETVTGAARVSPAAQVATFSTPQETIVANWRINVATQVATFSIPQYVVTAGGIVATPAVQQLTFDIPVASVLTGCTVSPDAQTLTFTAPVATPQANWQVSVNPVELTFSIPTLAFAGALWARTARNTGDWSRSERNNS